MFNKPQGNGVFQDSCRVDLLHSHSAHNLFGGMVRHVGHQQQFPFIHRGGNRYARVRHFFAQVIVFERYKCSKLSLQRDF